MTRTIKFSALCALLTSLFSCAVSKAIYVGPDNFSQRARSLLQDEVYSAENINGIFPEAVYIKTRTQTFDFYHYYILNDGKIWYKSADPDKEPRVWTIFEKTGIPHNVYTNDFSKPGAITEISADADELIALSEEGGFYRYCFDRNIARKSNRWHDRQGWPINEQLYLDPRAEGNVAWALGKRNSHVQYYEDIFGNQHHNGTMEIATTYVLLNDGQEISYADPGLPSDFSRNYVGPERGAFKASALSASASTMFVINEAGEMYTRLADFDTTGCDPMWFKYTYTPYTSDLLGTNYFSNLNEWGLPSEDWRAQPRIPLSGKAALTRHITILQNGQGNGARELRVAGLDKDGRTGYWSKMIFAAEWEFKSVPLYFGENAFLKTAAGDSSGEKPEDEQPRGERGPSPDKAYRGFRWNGSEKEDGMVFEIPNFNILEGDCELKITRGDETCTLKLHPVEMWTYLKRDYAPGRTGAPKVFLVTLEIPSGAFSSLSEKFAAELAAEFGKNHRTLFHYVMTASTRYLMIQNSDRNDSVLFLTDGTIADHYPDFQQIWYIEAYEEMRYYHSPDLTIEPDAPLTKELLARKITLNEQYIDSLKYQLRTLKWSGLAAFSLNAAYLPLHYFAAFTPLRFLDMPKIRTMTMFGDRLVLANHAHIVSTSNVRIWIITKIIEQLELRTEYYNDLARHLPSRSIDHVAANEMPYSSRYSESVSDFWNIAGLPQTVAGTFFSARPGKHYLETPAILKFIHSGTPHDISGWYLGIEGSEAFLILIDPLESPARIYSRGDKTPCERKLQLDGVLHINDRPAGVAERNIIDECLKPLMVEGRTGVRVRITFDGKNFEIRDYSSQADNLSIFRGTL